MIDGFLIDIFVTLIALVCLFAAIVCLIVWGIYLAVKKKRSKRAEIIGGIFIVLFISVIGYSWVTKGHHHPSDAKLIRNYEKNKEK